MWIKTLKSTILEDKAVLCGLIAIAVSGTTFITAHQLIGINQDNSLGIFALNYFITIIYSVALIFSSYRSSAKKTEYTILALILWFISAFSLNKEMNVFDDSVTWLCFFIGTSVIALLLAIFSHILPWFLKHLVFFCVGSGIVLFTYYAVYLIPLYLVSLPAALAVGISLHSYVPLLLAIFSVIICNKKCREQKNLKYAILLGIITPFLMMSIFFIIWERINSQIADVTNQSIFNENRLPTWVLISQQTPKNFVAERIIKSGLVYKTADQNMNWLFGGFGRRNFDEPMKHDPLVFISTLFSRETDIDLKDRIKILEAMYDSRHQAQERLWSGDKLETTNVLTHTQFFPEYRMAYTEKILNIKNNSQRSWRNEQEAIYTFHLSEGSVVSSLSLWINGKEEKAYLTTKSKADSAYKQIVGVEVKDPSVIHWQEGNTVTVRVFPCPPDEIRRFKIGVTSPLKRQGDKLIYENIYFDGPSAENAKEAIQIRFASDPQDFHNSDFTKAENNTYQLNRKYKADWKISFKAPSLSANGFSFNNSAYNLKEHKTNYTYFDAERIYLDINSSWSLKEFSDIWNKIKHKSVYAYTNEVIRLDEQNYLEVFDKLKKLNFGIFPLYRIVNPETDLLISKSNEVSPNLKDLDGCSFETHLKNYLKNGTKIRLYNLGETLSPYLKTLKELRVFNYQTGTVDSLLQTLEDKKFILEQENRDNVIIDYAGLEIQKSESNTSTNAPDHIYRLFAYNNILKKINSNYFDKDFLTADLITEAEQANIVTPVSSLIVLETQKDYERFGIEESKDSLKNASVKSSGAVPEPHEWMMILLTATVIIYLINKPKKLKTSN